MQKSLALFALLVACANAGYYGYGATLVGPGTHGAVLQGPSAKASLIGPDGSHISGYAAGGAVVAPPKPGGVVSASIEPGYVAHHAPAVVAHAPAYIAAPAYAAHAPALAAYSAYPAYAPGSGHEGQWVPDNTEHLYDDGSYKGEHYDEHY